MGMPLDIERLIRLAMSNTLLVDIQQTIRLVFKARWWLEGEGWRLKKDLYLHTSAKTEQDQNI